jgi:hypothetical protein
MELSSVESERERIARNIGQYGWHCVHVLPNEESQQQFTYTIGFSESFSQPEVMVFGVPREKAHALLAACADVLKGGDSLEPGIADDRILSGGDSVMFKTVRPAAFPEYLGTAMRYYGSKPFDATVMFLPDANHCFPWEPGYAYIDASEPQSIV